VRSVLFLVFLFLFAPSSAAASGANIRFAIVENAENLLVFKKLLAEKLSERKYVKLIDEDLTKAVINAQSAKSLFNLSLEEAKNLGAAVDCDFFLITKSAVWRRASLQKDDYFEAFAIVFLVSARTGRLVYWENARFEANLPNAAEKLLIADATNMVGRITAKVLEANERERTERSLPIGETILIEDLPSEAAIEQQNLRVPLPYRSLKPEYTEAARRLEIEATVDIAAELNERGEVLKTEVVRWAGFDLDDAAANTVKKMQFRPALRDGKAVPIRVVLRYNFRDLQREK
jgi:TonB family protein